MNIVISLINSIFYVIQLLVLIRCIISFLPISNAFTQWIYSATEPLLSPCRRLLGSFNFNLPVDFSPVLLLLILQFVQRIIMSIIVGLVYGIASIF